MSASREHQRTAPIICPLARSEKNPTTKCFGFLFIFVILLSFSGCASELEQPMQSTKYDYDTLINTTQAAFARKDADVAVEAFEEDGVFYRVTDEGIEELVSGKENLHKSLKMVFASENNYLESKAIRLGLIQNVLVMYHEDTYQTSEGLEIVPRVVVIEHRNGKRWREWEFNPKDR